MRHSHTHKMVWLCRCLTLMMLLTVTVSGATGWAQTLYLFSDGTGSAAALDESHPGIDSVLLNLETGKSGENAVLTAGTMVTVRRGGETITATARQETVKAFLQRMDIIPGSREMVGIELLRLSCRFDSCRRRSFLAVMKIVSLPLFLCRIAISVTNLSSIHIFWSVTQRD